MRSWWSRLLNAGGRKKLRRIKTARTVRQINNAAASGYRPLVVPVVPSPDIHKKFKVQQNTKTGKIRVLTDYRSEYRKDHTGWETVIPWENHYPYHWSEPFAAYLLPKDIKIGEVVVLEDLIEDRVGVSWNQGDAYRLQSCKAKWTGHNFDLIYSERTDRRRFIG